MSLSPRGPVDDAIDSRMSVRAFTQQPVQRADLEAILQLASRAPSGTNTQPWRVYALQGQSRQTPSGKVFAPPNAARSDPSPRGP